jgi:DNA processing protein
MTKNDLLYQLSLTLVPHIGPVQAKLLMEHFDNAAAVFKAPKSLLTRLDGIGQVRANSLKSFTGFAAAEEEIGFMEKFKITPLFLHDERYPKRLLNCYDPPTMLYYRGEADLNASRLVAVIGTRNKTEYGKHLAEQLVNNLAPFNVTIVSGLALGIDTVAHKMSLKNHMPTVAVLAHGLDKMYPHENVALAKDIVKQGGGLLTEFRRKTKPDKHHFPTRNRIVAGMCDATVVVETDIKGGSIITAELANGYNKDVFAFPGKVTDNKSAGCNLLIKTNKAMLLTDAQQLAEIMGWAPASLPPASPQKELFIDLTHDEKVIVGLLQQKEETHIDELNIKSGLSTSAVAAAILNLELQNLVHSLPGKRYRLV